MVPNVPKFINKIPVHIIKSTRNSLNLANPDECFSSVNYYRPDWIVNTAAFTAVEEAEQNPDLAFAINAEAPRNFAKALNKFGGKFKHKINNYEK